MVRIVWISLLAILFTQTPPSAEELAMSDWNPPRPLIMAHRGGHGHWPENTLFAFEQALDLGVDVIETDVRLTRDGQLVIMHNATVDQTTNGSGKVSEKTVAELQALDAGYRWTSDGATYPFRGQGIRIPTLSEALTTFHEARFNIDIKDESKEAVEVFCETLERHGAVHRVIAASFSSGTVKRVRKRNPDIATSAGLGETLAFHLAGKVGLTRFVTPDVHAFQITPRFLFLEPMTASFILPAHEAGIEIHVWTLNTPEQFRDAVDAGVDGIITAYPKRLVEFLGR